MTHYPDKAREAAAKKYREVHGNHSALEWEKLGEADIAYWRGRSDQIVDAFLVASVPTDKKIAEIQKRAQKTKMHLSRGPGLQSTHEIADAFIDDALTLVTALSANNAALQSELTATRKALELAQKWMVNSVPTKEIDGPKPLPVIADMEA